MHTHTHTEACAHTCTYTLVPPGSPLLTDASCPAAQPTPPRTHKHTQAACPWHPYRFTQGPGGGAAAPFASPVVFLLMLDPAPLCWPTHLSPCRRSWLWFCCHTGQEINVVCPLTSLWSGALQSYQTYCCFWLLLSEKNYSWQPWQV